MQHNLSPAELNSILPLILAEVNDLCDLFRAARASKGTYHVARQIFAQRWVHGNGPGAECRAHERGLEDLRCTRCNHWKQDTVDYLCAQCASRRAAGPAVDVVIDGQRDMIYVISQVPKSCRRYGGGIIMLEGPETDPRLYVIVYSHRVDASKHKPPLAEEQLYEMTNEDYSRSSHIICVEFAHGDFIQALFEEAPSARDLIVRRDDRLVERARRIVVSTSDFASMARLIRELKGRS